MMASEQAISLVILAYFVVVFISCLSFLIGWMANKSGWGAIKASLDGDDFIPWNWFPMGIPVYMTDGLNDKFPNIATTGIKWFMRLSAFFVNITLFLPLSVGTFMSEIGSAGLRSIGFGAGSAMPLLITSGIGASFVAYKNYQEIVDILLWLSEIVYSYV